MKANPSTNPKNRAYVSEPITRCPPREKGRIRTLVTKMSEALAETFGTELYIPSLVTSPEVRDTMTAEHVYLLDRIRVVESDFMLVCADHTSFGIGGEVEMASSLSKPIIIFSRDETLSRFLVGTPCNVVRDFYDEPYIRYRDWRELKTKLFPLIEKVLADLEPAKRSGIPHTDVGKQLRKWREKRGRRIAELADLTGLRPEHLTLLEKPFEVIRSELAAYEDTDIDLGKIDFTPHQIEELANIGLPALHKLAVALECSLAELLGESGTGAAGAARLAKKQENRLREIRTEQLARRAAQFDITYRQYQVLSVKLVDEVVDRFAGSPRGRARELQVIGEKELLDALADIGAPGFG